MTIRTFQPNDLDRIMEIWLAGNLDAHSFIPEDYWRSHVPEVRRLLPQAQLFICEEQHMIYGFAGMTGSYLEGIFVDKAYRCTGIGKALLDHLKTSCCEISLAVYEKNSRAKSFYLREGFLPVSQRTDSETNETESIMQWKQDTITRK